MDYEFFISYSSADRPWAKRIVEKLTGRGVTVFFDQTSLQDGEAWEEQVVDSMKASRHLICLSYEKAYESVVQNELGMFRTGQLNGGKGAKLFMMPPEFRSEPSTRSIPEKPEMSDRAVQEKAEPGARSSREKR